jgi:hypothetical protein
MGWENCPHCRAVNSIKSARGRYSPNQGFSNPCRGERRRKMEKEEKEMIRKQIENELKKLKVHGVIKNIEELCNSRLIIYTVDGKYFWGRLTAGGNLKKGSIRIDRESSC